MIIVYLIAGIPLILFLIHKSALNTYILSGYGELALKYLFFKNAIMIRFQYKKNKNFLTIFKYSFLRSLLLLIFLLGLVIVYTIISGESWRVLEIRYPDIGDFFSSNNILSSDKNKLVFIFIFGSTLAAFIINLIRKNSVRSGFKEHIEENKKLENSISAVIDSANQRNRYENVVMLVKMLPQKPLEVSKSRCLLYFKILHKIEGLIDDCQDIESFKTVKYFFSFIFTEIQEYADEDIALIRPKNSKKFRKNIKLLQRDLYNIYKK